MKGIQASARIYLRLVGCEYVALGALGLAGLHEQSESLYSMAALGAMFLLVTPLLLVMPSGIQAFDHVKPVGGSNLTPSEVHSAVVTVTLLCILSVLGGVLAVWGGKWSWVVLLLISGVTAVANCVFVHSWEANPLIMAASIFWTMSYVAAWTAAFPMRAKSI